MTPEKLPPETQPPDDPAARLAHIGRGNHGETREYRIFGPPGTGKTNYTAEQIVRAIDRFGFHTRILATSFSRTAAEELRDRIHGKGQEEIDARTLHSHAYRALARTLGEIRVAESHVDLWNERMKQSGRRRLAIRPRSKQQIERQLNGEGGGVDLPDDAPLGSDGRTGDDFLSELNIHRGLLIPESHWTRSLRDFAQLWSAYKRERKLLDFCDLIEEALARFPANPQNPHVVLADEAQDLNPLQLKLIRQWGGRAEYFILAGDDDQTIYAWTGARPEALLTPELPEKHNITLQQSFRVPEAVHCLAEAWIGQIPAGRRQPKAYRPRPAAGHVQILDRERISRLLEYTMGGDLPPDWPPIEGPGKVMILASCHFLLGPARQELYERGIPFHNPYRPDYGDWNPLRGERSAVKNQILALANAYPYRWTMEDVALWTKEMAAEMAEEDGGLRLLHPGAKTELPLQAEATPGARVSFADLAAWFTPAALESLARALEEGVQEGLSRLLRWWRARLLPKARQSKALDFACQVAARRGADILRREPRVVLGTIHSVKGGEADTVILFPELSRAGYDAYISGNPHANQPAESKVQELTTRDRALRRDAVIRQFYVGITRARHNLYLVRRENPMSVDLESVWLRARRARGS